MIVALLCFHLYQYVCWYRNKLANRRESFLTVNSIGYFKITKYFSMCWRCALVFVEYSFLLMFQERRGGKKWPYAFLLHEVFFPVKNWVANCILAADLREKQSRKRTIVLSCRTCTIQCMCCWLQWLPKVMNPLLWVL